MPEHTYPQHDQQPSESDQKLDSPVAPVAAAEPQNEPVSLSQQAPGQAPVPDPETSSTVALVWQWLTYGLWTWTLASLAVLLSGTLAYFISNDAHGGEYTWLVYVIATALCLLPVSFVIDRVYSKQEPRHKHGFAAVILVIHAVLAFLVSIGSLITAVVTLLSLATDTSGDSSVKITVIVSALLIAALGGLFFVRIVRPAKLEVISKKLGLIVSIVAAITIIAALAGPYITTIKTKSDRQIEAGLDDVTTVIENYASDNKKLPAALSDLTFKSYDNDAKALIKGNLVSYSQKGESNPTSSNYYGTRVYTYELCVTYKGARGSGEETTSNSADNSYINTSDHPAGHTCYKKNVSITGTSPTIKSGTDLLYN